MEAHQNSKHYGHLALMVVLHFISMYVLMYAMVDKFANVYSSFNQVYMAALMTSPMLIIELLLMRGMYPKQTVNSAVITAAVIVLVSSFLFIRWQTAIGDKQFLRSMIPHHAGALLMANEASIEDPEIKELIKNIISSQQSEIDWMKAKLDKLN